MIGACFTAPIVGLLSDPHPNLAPTATRHLNLAPDKPSSRPKPCGPAARRAERPPHLPLPLFLPSPPHPPPTPVISTSPPATPVISTEAVRPRRAASGETPAFAFAFVPALTSVTPTPKPVISTEAVRPRRAASGETPAFAFAFFLPSRPAPPSSRPKAPRAAAERPPHWPLPLFLPSLPPPPRHLDRRRIAPQRRTPAFAFAFPMPSLPAPPPGPSSRPKAHRAAAERPPHLPYRLSFCAQRTIARQRRPSRKENAGFSPGASVLLTQIM